MAGSEESVRERVSSLILLTQNHLSHEQATLPLLDQLFLDLDMSILGCDDERYKEYTQQVRGEYFVMGVEAFTKGRAAFLSGVLQKKLFGTKYAHDLWTEQANLNIGRELESLTK